MAHAPTIPYLLLHPQFVVKNSDERWQYEMEEPLLHHGAFNEAAYAIDRVCRKFRLQGIVERRSVYSIWNIPGIRRHRLVYVEYLFDPPEQLTFEQARTEFVEHVCSHGWWSDSYENENQFRARNAGYTTMAEVIEPVSLKGRWPQLKRKRN